MAESRSVYRRLMEQGRQRWIPITEFEPVGDSVLVTIKWDDGTYEVREMEYWKGKEAENSDDEVLRETARYTNAHVTAWMPLPKPYKEEEE